VSTDFVKIRSGWRIGVAQYWKNYKVYTESSTSIVPFYVVLYHRKDHYAIYNCVAGCRNNSANLLND